MYQDQRPSYDCERLYRYFEEVYEQLLQIGRARQLEELVQKDLIHELFLSFYEKQIDFDTISYPNSYIITSYKRKIIDLFRESHRYSQDDNWMNHPLTLIPSPETTLMEKESMQELTQLLRKAYDQLPERCKRAIFLKYYKGLSVSAIQAETGWSAQSIYNYLSIGLKQLKAELVVHPNLATGGSSMLLLLLFATI
ncbi:sigma-70 family RNA polymerase sigma factor [Flavihumibacter sp. RY-1]|uniref:Sigma-70 family RNA polymerase sigma factor n=1 Tax=Flavihumibacter fluminis TaxID=2909236 RepID=A0ABS9BN36_9BACT|nr:sigma-70 family RNA polymerase sigma factor [Flavihumibacter fluminis]MCF1716629.1 sigma-70 family RNA polymerase sigma factor [Flavihumibacter fluminis]